MAPDFIRLQERALEQGARAAAFVAPCEPGAVRWVDVGNQLRLIPVDEVLFFQSDEKYTLVATQALVKLPEPARQPANISPGVWPLATRSGVKLVPVVPCASWVCSACANVTLRSLVMFQRMASLPL